jgi:hypothetical protein
VCSTCRHKHFWNSEVLTCSLVHLHATVLQRTYVAAVLMARSFCHARPLRRLPQFVFVAAQLRNILTVFFYLFVVYLPELFSNLLIRLYSVEWKSEWSVGKDVEGSDDGLIKSIIPAFACRIRKTTKTGSQNSWFPGRDFNPGPHEYETQRSLTVLQLGISSLNGVPLHPLFCIRNYFIFIFRTNHIKTIKIA